MERKNSDYEIDVSILSVIYDIIRYVNPCEKSCEEPLDNACYAFWKTNNVCQNCTSMRALIEKKVVMKLEYSNNKLFMVTSVPQKNNTILELIRDVTNERLLENYETLSQDVIIEKIDKLNLEIVTDPLTGLYNRRFLDERLPYDIVKSYSNQSPLTLIMVDIDHFKRINDTYGHAIGDDVLKEFASLLKSGIRDQNDWVVRFGGEEFLIYLNAIDLDNVKKRVEKIRKSIEEATFVCDGLDLKITASFGVYSHKISESEVLNTCDYFYKFADLSLYEAKNSGRNCAVFYKG